MATTGHAVLSLDDSFARHLPELARPWPANRAPEPALVALTDDLAVELGLDPDGLRSPEGIDVLVGNTAPAGVTTVAQAYAGHQFGGFNPGLGDGRALLLGELVDVDGRRRDLHVKGSGPTPFARGGDGKAALGPMLREHLIGEAMHALGVPTTRGLAVLTTGEHVARESYVPGAVLVRVAASHLRVGTFQFAAMGAPDLVRRLADHAIERHCPDAAGAEQPYLALYEHVVEVQASLVARWMLVGFVHGVMNTDNTTISGETIDYGPCAFIDTHDRATVFSSIDHGGRYAYGNQPTMTQWNLGRLAEAMLPLFPGSGDAAVDAATAVLETFADRYHRHVASGMRAKLGLVTERDGDTERFTDLLDLMHERRVDHTGWFRSLSTSVVSTEASTATSTATTTSTATGDHDAPDDPRLAAWRERVRSEGRDPARVATEMDAANPIYIPRNHLVEEALGAATEGDLGPYRTLLEVVTDPYRTRPGCERYARPAPPEIGRYVTYCGT